MILGQYIQSLLDYFYLNTSLVRVFISVLIVLLVVFLRKPVIKFTIKLLKKIIVNTRLGMSSQIIESFEMPLRLIFFVFGIWVSTILLWLSDDVKLFINHVIRSIIAFSSFWIVFSASEALPVLLSKIKEKTEAKFYDILLTLISKSLKVVIITVGSTIIIQEWGYDISGLVAGLGLGGLAFALAAKDLAANLFGSITLMLDRPFTLGDWIYTPHVEGIVEEIGLRSTKVRTAAQALVSIPNMVMCNDAITNWTRMGKRRMVIKLGIAYETTPEKLEECIAMLRDMLQRHAEVHPEVIHVYFEKFGDSSLDILLYFFTTTTVWQKYLEIQQDINLKIMRILDELGVVIAFPSQKIYLET